MGSTTAKGYPYPLGTDRVSDGDNAIQALAEAVNSKAGLSCSGSVSVSAATGAAGNTAVTFPAGLFTATPAVTSTVNSNAPGSVRTTVSGASATGVTVYLYRDTGSGAANVYWIAQQTA